MSFTTDYLDETALVLSRIDPEAVERLVELLARIRADGGLLALISPSPAVARVLRLSALDQVIPVHASLEEAGVQ